MPSFRPRQHRRALAGFTLIELLVVIVIIGILVAIGVPAYLKYVSAANDRDAQAALRVAYKAAVAGDSEVNNGRFPVATSIVSDIKTSEPAASVNRGDCLGAVATAPVKQVLVDPSSTTSQITMCVKSASGAIWKLSGPLTGNPTVADGSVVALAGFTGGEITDAVRAANVQGDGRTSDSSTGVWEQTTNALTNPSFESGIAGWTQVTPAATAASSAWAKFGSGSVQMTYGGTNASIYEDVPAVPGDVWSTSSWVNVVSGSVEMYLEYLDASKTVISAWHATSSGTGVQQLVVSNETAPASTAYIRTIPIYMNAVDNGVGYVDAAQTEKLAVATPFTLTSRGAARVQAPTTLINTSRSWVAARVRIGRNTTTGSPGDGLFFLNDGNSGASNNGILCYWSATGSGSWTVYQRISGATQDAAFMGSSSNAPGTLQTVVCAWDPGSFYVSINGAAFNSAARAHGAPAGTMTDLELGSLLPWLTTSQLDGEILWLATGTGTLSNADVATINSWGSNDPKRSSFPASAQATMVWDGSSSNGSLK